MNKLLYQHRRDARKKFLLEAALFVIASVLVGGFVMCFMMGFATILMLMLGVRIQ